MIEQETRFDKDGKCVYAKLKVRKKFTDFNYECDLEKGYLDMKIGELGSKGGIVKRISRFLGIFVLFIIAYGIISDTTLEFSDYLINITILSIAFGVKIRVTKLHSNSDNIQILSETWNRIKSNYSTINSQLVCFELPDIVFVGHTTDFNNDGSTSVSKLFEIPKINKDSNKTSLIDSLKYKPLIFNTKITTSGSLGKITLRYGDLYYYIPSLTIKTYRFNNIWTLGEEGVKPFDIDYLKNDARFDNWDEIIQELEKEPEQNWIDANIINRLKYGSEK